MSRELGPKHHAILSQVIDFYLNRSRDFNGLPFDGAPTDPKAELLADLVRAGLLQVVSDTDWMNPHIRPWQSRRDAESQVQSLTAGTRVCLYPTPEALTDTEPNRPPSDEPYTTRMAKGGGTLELAYFQVDVLENYRNDPRYDFVFHDFGARCGVSNETYEDENEPRHDKTSISHIGFAYDVSTTDPDSSQPITRTVCAFLCDLRGLSARHQQRWRTYEITTSDSLRPHPVWWGQQMGRWPDGLGPFARFFYELRTWNELHSRIGREPLLNTIDRPREFGWVLRPSRAEYDHFVHLLDKLLSENIRHKALNELGVDEFDTNGHKIGTLKRLELLLVSQGVDADQASRALQPFRTVRRDRQGPAHRLTENVTDKDFVRRQALLLLDVNRSLATLRDYWASHPANREWSAPDYAERAGYWL
ncbi:ATPase AAA [Angustibacter speluncae]